METYEVGENEKVVLMDKDLKKDLSELKEAAEDSDLLYNHAATVSSVKSPKNLEYFQKQRKHAVNVLLNVNQPRPLKNQGELMMLELQTTFKSDLSDKGFPLLLHQFYVDKIKSIVQSKHLHMLRWRRFCEHTATIEKLYPDYKQKLHALDEEYKSAKEKAQRLSDAYSDFICGSQKGMANVKSEDIAELIEWVTSKLHLTKNCDAYIRILQWLPVIHKNNIDLSLVNTTNSLEASKLSSEDKSNWKSAFGDSEYSISGIPSSTHSTPHIDFSGRDFYGYVSNELNLSIPTHSLNLSDFRDNLENLAAEYGIQIRSDLNTAADEMELFGAVNRQFKRLFNIQEECKTFYPYDNVPEDQHHWGVDSPSHCLSKPSNWIKFIKIQPHKDPLHVKQIKRLLENGKVDELLQSQSRFLDVVDFSLVTESLKSHAIAVKDPPKVEALDTVSHKGGLKSTYIWNNIYKNPTLYNYDSGNAKGDAGDTGRKDEYNYSSTMQMLGLDEGEDTSNDGPTVVQGAYLSFLHLRHLKLRDLRRQCLALLNYFRSVERMITIYSCGLSLEGEEQHKQKETKSKHHSKKQTTKEVSKGIGSHQYLHNTPADHKIEEGKFMGFSGVANHDDFYQLDKDKDVDENVADVISPESQHTITAGLSQAYAIPHVQDQRGYYCVYDSAVRDLKQLEKELLLMASFYIEKDTDNRIPKQHTGYADKNRHDVPGEVNLPAYGHREVDRFSVLLDLWMCELNFLTGKQKVLNCYVESYNNTFDPKERRHVAQVITDVIHRRPRYDLSEDYFIQSYRSECTALRLHCDLITQVLCNHIEDSREYMKTLGKQDLLNSQLITINTPSPALKHVAMFEFHPTLGGVASRLYEALNHAYLEIIKSHNPKTMSERILLEKQLLGLAIKEYRGISVIGSSFSPQLQKDVFNDSFIKDPRLIKSCVNEFLKQDIEGKSKAEIEKEALAVWKNALEALLLRSRLINACWETEIISRIYKQFANIMGFEEFHLYLRPSQFEFSNQKDNSDPPPSTITSFIPDELSTDRYTSATLLLAVQELDENHLPKFSFHSMQRFAQMLREPNIIENIRMSLSCQILHKNSIVTAISQAIVCLDWKQPKTMYQGLSEKKESSQTASDTRSSHSASSQQTSRSGAQSPSMSKTHLSATKLNYGIDKHKKCQEAFISIQITKTGPRNVVLNHYIHKKNTNAMMLKKPGEVEKLKRQLIEQYCIEVSFRMKLHAMRAQIIKSYDGILKLLSQFPSTRDTYFIVGLPNEKKRKTDDIDGLIPNSTTFKRRPHRVITPDGKNFINLWFIPHYSEVLVAYRKLDYESQQRILSVWLHIVASLFDILQCLCAHSKLGINKKKSLDKTSFDIAADWGGVEGVGAELVDIQHQIEHLRDGVAPAKNPQDVAEFLTLRRDVLMLQFDVALRIHIKDRFLATNNVHGFNAIVKNLEFGLSNLSDRPIATAFHLPLNLPKPIRKKSAMGTALYAWLSFEFSNGPYSVMDSTCWDDIERCMQICLASCTSIERQVANGEILGTLLVDQDVLYGGMAQLDSLKMDRSSKPEKGFIASHPLGKAANDNDTATGVRKKSITEEADENENKVVTQKEEIKQLTKLEHPILSYKLLRRFYILCKQLEVAKMDWSKKKLNCHNINNTRKYNEMNSIYTAEILLPVYKSITHEMGTPDEYDSVGSYDEVILPPKGATEITIKARQLLKLLEILECQMIMDVRNKINQDLSLLQSERLREETALPTDLWKSSAITQQFTTNKPTIVEEFMHGLMADYSDDNLTITFNKDHLNSCVKRLSTAVMSRERENYENYSMFYENLLRHHQHLLFQKEQEIRVLQSGEISGGGSKGMQAQFQLADRSHELILEITALRAKITEMRNESLSKERDVREKVQNDYKELISSLFEVCYQVQGRLDRYSVKLHENVESLISDTRNEAMQALGNLKEKTPTSTAEERLRTIQAKDVQLKKVMRENSIMQMWASKLKSLNHWRTSTTQATHKEAVIKLQKELDRTKRSKNNMEQNNAQEIMLLKEQLDAAHKSLQALEIKLKKTHQQLDSEKRMKEQRDYLEQQEAENRKHLAQAQQKNFDRMMMELREKDARLKNMTVESSRNEFMLQCNESKIKRETQKIQSQLTTDRSLKLDAFSRVDDLQAQLLDQENHQLIISRTTSAISTARSKGSTRSRALPSVSSTSPYHTHIRLRPHSSMPAFHIKDQLPVSRRNRPKTASGQLKSKIAAALLAEIDKDYLDHNTTVSIISQ